jgi:hypothetical protein
MGAPAGSGAGLGVPASDGVGGSGGAKPPDLIKEELRRGACRGF